MPLRSEKHIDPERIEMYSLGGLADGETADIDEHLLVCEHCRESVEKADRYARAMRSAARTLEAEPAGTVSRWWFRPPVWAAACAVLLIGAFFLFRPHTVSAPIALHLAAFRGFETTYPAPARTPLELDPDLTGLPPGNYELEMVDGDGRSVWKGSSASGRRTVPGLAPGAYFLRVHGAKGELLREYAIVAAKTPAASGVPR